MEAYRSGKMLTSELKDLVTGYVLEFLAEHQKAREEAKKHIDAFLLKTPIRSILELNAFAG